MIVSGNDLIKLVFDQKVVTPVHARDIQVNSLDIYLGDKLLVFTGALMDPQIDMGRFWRDVDLKDGAWLLKPGSLYLGVTKESITMPADVAGELFGVSSLGRCGIQIHSTAGWIDAGYHGRLTVELTVQAAPTLLRPGQRIGQLVFHRMTTASDHVYHGRYQGDTDPVPSRAYLDYPEKKEI